MTETAASRPGLATGKRHVLTILVNGKRTVGVDAFHGCAPKKEKAGPVPRDLRRRGHVLDRSSPTPLVAIVWVGSMQQQGMVYRDISRRKRQVDRLALVESAGVRLVEDVVLFSLRRVAVQSGSVRSGDHANTTVGGHRGGDSEPDGYDIHGFKGPVMSVLVPQHAFARSRGACRCSPPRRRLHHDRPGLPPRPPGGCR